MIIAIEKDIPLPTRAKMTRSEKYPFLRTMSVGDSAAVPITPAALAAHTRRVGKEIDAKFVIRRLIVNGEDCGSRVWRKA